MILYTLKVKDDQTRTYDCGLCGNYEMDVDSARAHQAVHAAGPELLKACKYAIESIGSYSAENDLMAAIAKAEPRKETT